MTRENAIKKIEKAVDAMNAKMQYANMRGRRGYQLLILALEGKRYHTGEVLVPTNIIRPAYYSSRGRFTTLQDHTADMQAILKAAGIKYTLTNDAPRGSVTGNIITLTNIK